MRHSLLLDAVLVVSILYGEKALSQSWSDSVSHDDRFWSFSGGYARQIALGAGGFGMLGDSGITTMGVNPFSVDPIFAFQNPAYIVHYPGYLAFDAGYLTQVYNSGINGYQSDGVGQSFEGFFPCSQVFTLGLVIARNDASTFTLVNPNLFSNLTSQVASVQYSRPNNTWEVMGSFRMGEVDAGIGVSYLATSQGTSAPSVLDSGTSLANFSQLGISLGTLVRFPSDLLLDIGGAIILPDLKNATSSGTAQTASSEWSMMAVGINSRVFLPLGTDFYLVPIANFYGASGNTTKVGAAKDLPSSTNVDAGIGVNFWQSGVHVMSGVSFGYYQQLTPAVDSFRPQLTRSQTIAPRFTIGAEWPALRWLTVRLGYFSSSIAESDQIAESATQTTTVSSYKSNLYSPIFYTPQNAFIPPPSGITAGLGFRIERLSIDVTATTLFFHEGFAALATGLPFGFATLSYRFD